MSTPFKMKKNPMKFFGAISAVGNRRSKTSSSTGTKKSMSAIAGQLGFSTAGLTKTGARGTRSTTSTPGAGAGANLTAAIGTMRKGVSGGSKRGLAGRVRGKVRGLAGRARGLASRIF